ncbi:hypothetical protein CTI14_64135, partial [Methylobacterium radiotolerans]
MSTEAFTASDMATSNHDHVLDRLTLFRRSASASVSAGTGREAEFGHRRPGRTHHQLQLLSTEAFTASDMAT